MVFKLVRTDTEEPYKIQLSLGTHLIGRGNFLDCDDKRVSRNHGELDVTSDSIKIKALHSNPCFFIKKGTEDAQVLKQNLIANLCHGDKFGLLPDSYWYEVLHCSLLDPEKTDTQTLDTNNQEANGNSMNDQTIRDNTNDVANGVDNNSDGEKVKFELLNEYVGNAESPESPSLIPRGESPSLTPIGESPSLILRTESPSLTPLLNQSPTQNYNAIDPAVATDEPKTPSKRSHSSEDAPEVKKVKLEPEDVKQEPGDVKDEPVSVNQEPVSVKQEPVSVKQEPKDVKPGPSNNQGGASTADNGDASAQPPSPVKPPNSPLGRERCMYGATCYRKNPQHKVQFSHPSDPDWGAGSRGVCPWGGGCSRRDPRHWRDHEHPPGVQRPASPRPGMQVVQRNGNVFYINAHSVNFYDDHFQVEDSDGDSVDYDYEF